MLDLDADPRLRRLFQIARRRVSLGFVVAAAAFWFATPSWHSLGLGALVATGGESLRVWAAGHLRKGQEVTSSGPYRFIRHPLYCGSFVVAVGFVVAAANIVVALIVGTYLSVMMWAAVRLEEATLRDQFGSEYDRYITGDAGLSRRRFSVEQVVTNGEHQALVGFLAALGILGLKVWDAL